MIRRTAIILASCTVADCPLEAECISTLGDGNQQRKVVCGHYQGSITNSNGSHVVCGYVGE